MNKDDLTAYQVSLMGNDHVIFNEFNENTGAGLTITMEEITQWPNLENLFPPE